MTNCLVIAFVYNAACIVQRLLNLVPVAIEFAAAAAAIAFHSKSMVEVEDPPSSYGDMIILSESMPMCHHTMYYTMNFFHIQGNGKSSTSIIAQMAMARSQE